MDINLLVVNVGNSRVAVGAFVKGNLEFVRRLPIALQDDFRSVIAEAWEHLGGAANSEVAGASVNPTVAKAVEAVIDEVTGKNVQWVGEDIDLPIKVKTDEPKKTGVDRVLTMAAAYEQMEKACVVVDAGTAITVNVCNDAGEFLGGAIAPGASMMIDMLHDNTAKLPHVPLAPPVGLIGKNTEQAILHGIYHGTRGMVKELVENYATELGNWPDIICTGGDAEVIFNGWELVHAISPDLILYGIALAYTEHYIKHQD